MLIPRNKGTMLEYVTVLILYNNGYIDDIVLAQSQSVLYLILACMLLYASLLYSSPSSYAIKKVYISKGS